jgi:dCTP deaminase
MILTGQQIASDVAAGRITIEPYTPDAVEPNSYRFHLADQIICYDHETVDCATPPAATGQRIGPEGVVVEPGRVYLGATVETMGSRHYAATLYGRRSVATLGVWIQFSAPLGHAGALIPWTLEITVAQPVRLYPRMPIGKIAFWAMAGRPIQYAGRYRGSAGVVASRMSLGWRLPNGGGS